MQLRTERKTEGSEAESLMYRPFHKTLPRSSAFLTWISVRFYNFCFLEKPAYGVKTVLWTKTVREETKLPTIFTIMLFF